MCRLPHLTSLHRVRVPKSYEVEEVEGPPVSLPSWIPLRLTCSHGTRANLVDSLPMTRIIFRDLPAVSAVERQLDLHARDHLLDDEIDELPYLIDAASTDLFGITQGHTFYPTPSASNMAARRGNRSSTCSANIRAIRTRTGGRSTSIFDVPKGAACIAWRCSGGSWCARSTGSIRAPFLRSRMARRRVPPSLDRPGGRSAS